MRDRLLLASAGAALLLTQYVATREIGSTFFSTELTALIGVLVTMIGPSVGYALAARLSPAFLATWGALSVAAHVALPVGLRALVGALSARGFDAWALAVTVLGGSFLLSGFYAVFLPRVAREPATLGKLYAAELGGALAALALIAASPSWRVTLAAYFAVAVLVVHLGLRSRALTAAAAALVVLVLALYPRLDAAAARAFLVGYHGHRDPRLVATSYSPYQRIDVVDDVDGRSLYLDGVPFYRGGDLDAFNVFLADLPGSLVPAGRALVIGSGSFSSAGFLARRGWDVTVVELDAEVARLGFRHFADRHRLAEGAVRLVVDDGRRFVDRSPERAFDLIVLDVPAPYHVRTALLHTPSFYRRVASRLTPGGVAAISLCDELEGPVGRAIAASGAHAFGELAVVESNAVGLGILYAAPARLPFPADRLRAELAARDPDGGHVFDDAQVRRAVDGAEPLDEARLAPVLVMARGALP